MTPLARVLNLVLLPTIVAPTWSARHAGFLEAQRRKISPPPPPPMNKWSAVSYTHLTLPTICSV